MTSCALPRVVGLAIKGSEKAHLGYLKKVQIRVNEAQTTQFGSGLTTQEDVGILQILRDNVDLFA